MLVLPFTCLEILSGNTEVESKLANHILSNDCNARLLFFFSFFGDTRLAPPGFALPWPSWF